MPDGSAHRLLPEVSPAPARPPRDGFAGAAVLAVALHAAALLPLVWTGERTLPPTVVEDVEVSPLPEAAPQAADAASFAEAVAAAPPDPVQAAEPPPEPVQEPPPSDQVQPPPPERVQAAAPPESVAPQRPSEPLQQTPSPEPARVAPPEPMVAEMPPPDPLPAETPELAEAVPPDQTAAAVPPPPPPAPPPPQPARVAAPPPRPATRPAPSPRLSAAEAPSADASAAAPVPLAPRPQPPPPSYVGRLLAALDRHKEYPSGARWRRAEGTALLRFSMRRDGTVASWRIERSSGHADLDAAVAQMIQRASPLPVPPAELAGDPVELVVPVRFSLR